MQQSKVYSTFVYPAFEKFPKTLILAFEANIALSCENETKIVKITYSVLAIPSLIFRCPSPKLFLIAF